MQAHPWITENGSVNVVSEDCDVVIEVSAEELEAAITPLFKLKNIAFLKVRMGAGFDVVWSEGSRGASRNIRNLVCICRTSVCGKCVCAVAVYVSACTWGLLWW